MPNTPQHNHDEQKSQVQDYFSRTAESYVRSFSHKSGDDLQRLVEVGEWDKRQQVLDIATGGGHTALAIAPYVAQVTVSDLTPRMLEKAREYLTAQGVTNAHYVVADAEHLPFAAETFDRVTCRIAAHHFPDIRAAVAEMARVSNRLLVIEDNVFRGENVEEAERLRDPTHVRSYSEDEWKEMVTGAAFEVEQVEQFAGRTPRGVRRMTGCSPRTARLAGGEDQ